MKDADLFEVRARWADSKPRCRMCSILLTDGAPGTPCYREGCAYISPFVGHDSPYGASSLAGDDFTVA